MQRDYLYLTINNFDTFIVLLESLTVLTLKTK